MLASAAGEMSLLVATDVAHFVARKLRAAPNPKRRPHWQARSTSGAGALKCETSTAKCIAHTHLLRPLLGAE